jgi:hypothetical protein
VYPKVIVTGDADAAEGRPMPVITAMAKIAMSARFWRSGLSAERPTEAASVIPRRRALNGSPVSCRWKGRRIVLPRSGGERERAGGCRIEWDSIEGFADFFMERFGPMLTAKNMLGELFAKLRQKILAVWRDATRPTTAVCDSRRNLLSLVRL